MRCPQFNFTAVIAGLLSAAALAVPATSAASTGSFTPTSGSDVSAATIAKAEAVDEPGFLMEYSPATDSWSELGLVDQPFASTSSTDAIAKPEIDKNAAIACILSVWAIGVCNDIAVEYEDVVPTTASAILSSLETVDEETLEQTKEDYNEWKKKDEVIQGQNVTEGDKVEGGYEDKSDDGVEDDALDFGSGEVDVVINVLTWGS